MAATTTEYVYSPPSGRIMAPRGYVPAGNQSKYNTGSNPLGGAVVVRTPLDASILEQQMRMFMVEKRGGVSPAEQAPISKPWISQSGINSRGASPTPASSHSYFSFGPTGVPTTEQQPAKATKPGKTKKPAISGPIGPNRNTILPVDVPPPPKMTERPAVPSLSTGILAASPASGIKRSPVVGKGTAALSSRGPRKASPLTERSASPVPPVSDKLIVDHGIVRDMPSPSRQRAYTDAGVMPPAHLPRGDDYRPRVPAKDTYIVGDHSRSRSLSPPPVAAAPKKEEKKRNVFGLFPAEKKEKEAEKKGVADTIATMFYRKAAAASDSSPPQLSVRSVPTPQMPSNYISISPPQQQQWVTSTQAQYGYSQPSSTPGSRSHSRENSVGPSSRSQSRSPSSLSNQVFEIDAGTVIDIDEAIEKVWGPLGSKSNQTGRALHRALPNTVESSRNGPRSRSRELRKNGFGGHLANDSYPNPSPLLPPVNKEAYTNRSLPPAPAPVSDTVPPRASTPSSVPVPPASPELEPVAPLLPVAYCPDDDEDDEVEEVPASQPMGRSQSDINPLSPGIEPLQPIAMQPTSPRRVSARMTTRLSVFIPPIGKRLTADGSYSAPGTPAEENEMRYYLELPEGLGDFYLDSALAAQEEEDILSWLDSFNFNRQVEKATEAQATAEPEEPKPAPAPAAPSPPTPELIIEAAPETKEQPASRKSYQPGSPGIIPRKPVGSPHAPPNKNLLSPPAPPSLTNSPPSPSDYSSSVAFGARTSFASSVGDAFKYDNYADEIDSVDWRSAVLSEYEHSEGGLRLRGVSTCSARSITGSPLNFSSPNPSTSSGSSPQTNPSTTFSSPNFSDYSSTASSPPTISSSSDAKGPVPFDVYIDGTESSGLLTAEIEAILAAQARDDEELKRLAEKQRLKEEKLEKEYMKRMEARRTRYVRGRNSEFEGDILFVLKSEDMI